MNYKYILISAVVMLLLDYIYLYLTKDSFIKMVVNIQNTTFKFNLLGAIISYTLLIIANYKFLYNKKSDYKDAFLLGIIIYGVFDGTNLALFKNYDINLGIKDTLWGGILMTITYYLSNKIYLNFKL